MSHTINSGGARNRNVDCFKIFLMVLIVTHHGIVHGLGLKNKVDVTTSGRFELIVFFLPLCFLESIGVCWKLFFILLYATLLSLTCMGIDSIRKKIYDCVKMYLDVLRAQSVKHC